MNQLPEVDVFISNYTLVDPEVYQLWVDGCSSADAVSTLEHRGIIQKTGASLELVKSDVLDHYRTYSLLERLLHTPPKLAEQLAFQIEPQTRRLLIDKYYELDDSVVRELLGKKLSSRHRKDLDEVSEKTGAHLKSCRRQFDNIKRVFKLVEEMQGSLVVNIQTGFLLPTELAERYAAVVFLGCLRLETSKRRLAHLTCADLNHCAWVLMNNWTVVGGSGGDVGDDTELDREFLLDLRELRVLLDKEKEHKHLVCARLKPQLLERCYSELDNGFRAQTRALIGTAANLNRPRELRSLLPDLAERCVEPLRAAGWLRSDLKHFLEAYTQSALEMDVLREPDLKATWQRYMTVISACLLRMFHT